MTGPNLACEIANTFCLSSLQCEHLEITGVAEIEIISYTDSYVPDII
jgi:hypothetical protein